MSKASDAKNSAMAKHMKERGIKRTSGNCPLCHHLVSNGALATHFLGNQCQPRRRSVPRFRSA
jgi:hypothetical protein